jgi:hypothetical protein
MVRMPNRIVMPPSAKKMNGLKFSKSKLPDNLKIYLPSIVSRSGDL